MSKHTCDVCGRSHIVKWSKAYNKIFNVSHKCETFGCSGSIINTKSTKHIVEVIIEPIGLKPENGVNENVKSYYNELKQGTLWN